MIRFGSFSEKMPQKRSFLNTGGMIMDRFELLRAEEVGAASGWVSPLSQEDRDYFAYLRKGLQALQHHTVQGDTTGI